MDFILDFIGAYSIIAIIYAIVMFLFPFVIWQKMNNIIEELKKQNENIEKIEDKIETIEYIKKKEHIKNNPETDD